MQLFLILLSTSELSFSISVPNEVRAMFLKTIHLFYYFSKNRIHLLHEDCAQHPSICALSIPPSNSAQLPVDMASTTMEEQLQILISSTLFFIAKTRLFIPGCALISKTISGVLPTFEALNIIFYFLMRCMHILMSIGNHSLKY